MSVKEFKSGDKVTFSDEFIEICKDERALWTKEVLHFIGEELTIKIDHGGHYKIVEDKEHDFIYSAIWFDSCDDKYELDEELFTV